VPISKNILNLPRTHTEAHGQNKIFKHVFQLQADQAAFTMDRRTSLLIGLASICLFLLFASIGAAAANPSLVVVTNNMGTINGNLPNIENIDSLLIKRGTPDIVFLQEVPSAKLVKVIAAKLKLPYTTFLLYKPWGRYGVAILARYTLSAPRILRQNGYASISARMNFKGTSILLCSVHLVRILPLPVKNEHAVVSWSEFAKILYSEVFLDNQRSHDVGKLLPWLNEEGMKTVIVGGDFNTFPFSKAVSKMTGVYDDCFWPSWDYLTTSYPKVDFPVKPRIDHLFHSSDMKCVGAGVIKETVGDHYPVWGKIEIKKRTEGRKRTED
jgi:endonuclease/exonuclease/phosphatase (EEP) superfamily protein YafD